MDALWTAIRCKSILVIMMNAMEQLAFFMLIFVGGHFLLSGEPARHYLVSRIGEGRFRGFYSLFALGSFLPMLMGYGAAPFQPVWEPPPVLSMVPLFIMPLSCILMVCSLTTPNVTMAGGERLAGDPHAVPGIMTITRHPFLWAAGLWSLAHLAANGDLASIILFGGILILSLGGMYHIDRRRAASLGSDWGPIVLSTSVIPFRAVLENRTRVNWRGIGWYRAVGGLILYLVLAFAHEWIAGVSLV